MALSIAEAEAMIAAARSRGVKLCTNHNYLFKPSVVKARQMVDGGQIGRVVYVLSYYGLSGEGSSYSGTAGRSHWARHLPGGAFTNFLPHLIYLQLAFLGQVAAVDGVTLLQEPGAPPSELSALLRGPDAVGMMIVSMRVQPYAKFVEVYGTKGILHADLVREVCTLHRARPLPRMVAKAMYNLESVVQLGVGTAQSTAKVALGSMKNYPGLHELVRAFYVSLQQGQEPPVPGEEGRTMVGVLERVWDQCKARESTTTATSIGESSAPRTEAERTVAQHGLPGRVLVTGATGFLGYRLAAALARCGADVVALVRDKTRVAADLERQATILQGDVRDPQSVRAAMQDVSLVFHCAAITTNRAPWRDHEETNITGTRTVLTEAKRAGVKRVVYVSSVVVYGLDPAQNGRPFDESTPYASEPDRWAYYLRSKLEADRLALTFGQESGLPVTVVRPGILYGPGAARQPGRGLLQAGRFCALVGAGRNHLPYAYVDNVVDCLLLAAISEQAVGQAYNVFDEPQVTVREFVERCGRGAAGKPIVLPVPAVLLALLARVQERKSARVGAELPPKLSRYVVESVSRDVRYDSSKAREQLGWRESVPLDQAIESTLCDGA